MQYQFVTNANGPDRFNGTYEKSNGGTENVYRQLISKISPEHLERFQIICSRVRDLEPNKKKLLWLHDRYEDPENKHLSDQLSQNRFDKILFVSNHQFQTYHQAYKIPYGKSLVVRNAIEPIEYKNKPTDRINLIYHTTPHRGLEILVPVFVWLAKDQPDIHLDVYSSFEIYGWGDRDQQYKELFEICQNHPQITYHGYQPNSVVREALQQSHIFAYPSIWPETSCIAAIEAGAAGCAVVSSDLGALPETMLNYGFMYRYDEDVQRHGNVFATVLNSVIIKARENNLLVASETPSEFQTHVIRQSGTFNSFYSWNNRIVQWEEIFKVLS